MTIPAALRHTLDRAPRDAAFLAAGVPLHLAMMIFWVPLVLPKHKAVGLTFTAMLLVPLVTVALTAAQRRRYRELLGVRLPRLPAPPGRRGLVRALVRQRPADAWRQAGYHAVAGPAVAVAELTVLAAWLAGVAASTYYAWEWVLPPDWRLPSQVQAVYITVLGVVLLAAAPFLAGSVVTAETRLAAALLGPGRAGRLEHRVADLTQSRAGVVDAADAERRRIERDLHDGAQQRLVSLAVNLGLAKATLTELPDQARRVIDDAHREAKEAIEELNHLVRGLHPAVLEDRGLDAALSGLAARVPLPVRLRVRLETRPPPSVEAVAYFVVSEALTNVTKHSGATLAGVTVEHSGQMLRVTVTDDGGGGADPSAGSGLAGLAKRVRSVDGSFSVHSPTGGPTTLTAELPCGL